jgi:hypothetical protein
MHFVGKILVVLLFVLSILFMAFAGLVHSARENWRGKSVDLQKTIDKNKSDLNKAQQDFQNFKDEMEAKLKLADNQAKNFEAENGGLKAEITRLSKANADLAVARKTAAEQATVAGDETSARFEESTNLRSLNHVLALARDADLEIRTKLEDQLRGLQLDYDTAKQKNKDLVAKVSVLQQALQSLGIDADATELANRNNPPPRVEGIVEATMPPKRQGASELVEISLGSDDGLKKGDEMTVYRTGLKGGKAPRYLARIIIVETTPDKAVGRVLENSRNGVIQKGDNVSTYF